MDAAQRHLLITIFAFQTFEDEISATVLDNLCVDLVHAEGDAGLLFHNPEVCHLEVIDALVLYFARNGEVEVMHIEMVYVERVASLMWLGLNVPLKVGAADDGVVKIQIDLEGAFLLVLLLGLGFLILCQRIYEELIVGSRIATVLVKFGRCTGKLHMVEDDLLAENACNRYAYLRSIYSQHTDAVSVVHLQIVNGKLSDEGIEAEITYLKLCAQLSTQGCETLIHCPLLSFVGKKEHHASRDEKNNKEDEAYDEVDEFTHEL